MGIQTLFVGDSVAHGSLTPGRLTVTPRENINLAQTVFEIPLTLDYTKGGAATSGWLSPDPSVREAHGMPLGCTFEELIDNTGCQAVLFCIGGNDPSAGYASRIKTLAGYCIARSLPFAFVGLVDIDIIAAYDYAETNSYFPPNTSIYDLGYIDAVSDLAKNAEILRCVCRWEGYPYLDTRSLIPPIWGDITGDFVHPNQRYSTAIFDRVGRAIAGLP